MKQISQHYKSGAIRLREVDAPLLRRGGVMVRTHYSVISAGTEGMKAREGKMSYLAKARARPDQVKQVMQSLKQQGPSATYRKVMNKLDAFTPLGYSLSGVVEAVGAEAGEFTVGQRVACAGVGYANHAEVNYVPRNLAVPVPEDVCMRDASFATIGAIALQGLRQAEMQMGETGAVIGLGLIGQILVQLLAAGGMRVIGVDVDETRCGLACRMGADAAWTPSRPDLHEQIRHATRGLGADVVFLCAGAAGNQPLELAVALARDRGRIVDIGKTRLDLPWKECFEKELDLRFSRSYGPGRYDPGYEEKGIDYPIGYVRWTERRNLAAVLDLIARGRLDLGPIVSEVVPFSEAESVYEALSDGRLPGLGIVFEHTPTAAAPLPSTAPTPATTPPPLAGSVRVGAIGAGNYAGSMLLPHLAAHPDVHLATVATSTSLSGAQASEKFGFARTTTDYAELLEDPELDAVVIATRHASHAALAAEALAAGKAVFVEKPLALDAAGVEGVRRAVVAAENDRLLVGFNRRHAPLVRRLAERFQGRSHPVSMLYRVHAGRLEPGSWYLDPAEGGRFLGEAGHFFDVFAFLARSRPVQIQAASLAPATASPDDRENLSVTVTYEDGSLGTLLYLTQGGAKLPKELLEVHGGGLTARLDNFRRLDVYSERGHDGVRGPGPDKGQARQMQAFVEAVKTGGPMPISLDSLLDTTLVTLAAAESAATGRSIRMADLWTLDAACRG